jgi:hypothetical protein
MASIAALINLYVAVLSMAGPGRTKTAPKNSHVTFGSERVTTSAATENAPKLADPSRAPPPNHAMNERSARCERNCFVRTTIASIQNLLVLRLEREGEKKELHAVDIWGGSPLPCLSRIRTSDTTAPQTQTNGSRNLNNSFVSFCCLPLLRYTGSTTKHSAPVHVRLLNGYVISR